MTQRGLSQMSRHLLLINSRRVLFPISTTRTQQIHSSFDNPARLYQYNKHGLSNEVYKYLYKIKKPKTFDQIKEEEAVVQFGFVSGFKALALMAVCGFIGFNIATLVVSIAGPRNEEESTQNPLN
jgi:hypothetical protein